MVVVLAARTCRSGCPEVLRGGDRRGGTRFPTAYYIRKPPVRVTDMYNIISGLMPQRVNGGGEGPACGTARVRSLSRTESVFDLEFGATAHRSPAARTLPRIQGREGAPISVLLAWSSGWQNGGCWPACGRAEGRAEASVERRPSGEAILTMEQKAGVW